MRFASVSCPCAPVQSEPEPSVAMMSAGTSISAIRAFTRLDTSTVHELTSMSGGGFNIFLLSLFSRKTKELLLCCLI